MIAITEQNHAAGRAFDSVAEAYDGLFTNSLIGRAQRSVVWKRAAALFPAGSRVLELNCGTGEDAAFLASRGVAVTACDVSARMIEQAQQRRVVEGGGGSVEYHVLPSEQIDELPSQQFFDGAFSNFSGLNCVSDLSDVAGQLAKRLRPGAPVLFCMSTRFCVWEMLYYLAKLDTKRAFRRCKGISRARLGPEAFSVYYPLLHSVSRSFQPFFRLRSVTGVGVFVPPSYVEAWAERHPSLLRLCEKADAIVCRWPVVRVLGDHMLLHLERV